MSKLFNFLLIVGFIIITTAITISLGGPSDTTDSCDLHPQRAICDRPSDPAFREFAQDRAFGG